MTHNEEVEDGLVPLWHWWFSDARHTTVCGLRISFGYQAAHLKNPCSACEDHRNYRGNVGIMS